METIITGFLGETNSAKLLLDSLNTYAIKLLVPNNKEQSFFLLKEYIQNNTIIIMVGQKPSLSNKISIETQAKKDTIIHQSGFPYHILEENINNQYKYKFSTSSGTSFCNSLYYNVLDFIKANNLTTKAVFIHIPQIKNITNFSNLKNSFEKILSSFIDIQ